MGVVSIHFIKVVIIKKKKKMLNKNIYTNNLSIFSIQIRYLLLNLNFFILQKVNLTIGTQHETFVFLVMYFICS